MIGAFGRGFEVVGDDFSATTWVFSETVDGDEFLE